MRGHEGKFKSNLGESDPVCRWSGGESPGEDPWRTGRVLAPSVVSRSSALGHTMCTEEPGPLKAAPVSCGRTRWWEKGVDPALEGAQGLSRVCGPVATTENQGPKWMWAAAIRPCRVWLLPLGTGPICAPGPGLRAIPVLSHLVSRWPLGSGPFLVPWTKIVGSPGKGHQEPGSTAPDKSTQHPRNLFIWQIRLIKSFFPINCASFTHVQVTSMSRVFWEYK